MIGADSSKSDRLNVGWPQHIYLSMYMCMCISFCLVNSVVFGQSLLFGLLSITTHEWVFPATRNTHTHTTRHTQTYQAIQMRVSYIYHYHCEWLQRYPTFCFVVWARVIRKFLSVWSSCARIYSCGSIKARAWRLDGNRTKAKPQPSAELNWTQRELNECGASKQSIWKIQLYARNSSIRTTFFFYLFCGH